MNIIKKLPSLGRMNQGNQALTSYLYVFTLLNYKTVKTHHLIEKMLLMDYIKDNFGLLAMLGAKMYNVYLSKVQQS